MAVGWVAYQGFHDSPGSVELCRARRCQVRIIGEVGDGEVGGEMVEGCSGCWWKAGSCKKYRWEVTRCKGQGVKAVGGQIQRCTLKHISLLPFSDFICTVFLYLSGSYIII